MMALLTPEAFHGSSLSRPRRRLRTGGGGGRNCPSVHTPSPTSEPGGCSQRRFIVELKDGKHIHVQNWISRNGMYKAFREDALNVHNDNHINSASSRWYRG